MYTANKTHGVGRVTEVTENMVKVYFEEGDVERSLLKAFTKIYNTKEEAELAINPEITQEEVDARMADAEQEKKELEKGLGASNWLAEKNRENALKNLPSSMR